MRKRYKLSLKERLNGMAFSAPEGAVEISRGLCEKCFIPVATMRVGTKDVITNNDGTKHWRSCTGARPPRIVYQSVT